MARQRVNQLIGKSSLSSIRQRALWLAARNECLQRQLPLSINTEVTLVNVDSRQRAVLHVSGSEWATQIRLQQSLIMALLKSCGAGDLKGVVVKNRPASLKPVGPEAKAPEQRPMSPATRSLVEDTADGVSDPLLRESLKRLARKHPKS